MIRLCVNLAATYAPTTHGAILPPLLSLSASQLRFTWQGREYSRATGLYNFRARWYDPSTGRWLSKDPIGLEGGLNLYEAFGNNPMCFRDPMGMDWFDVWGKVIMDGANAVGDAAVAVGETSLDMAGKAWALPNTVIGVVAGGVVGGGFIPRIGAKVSFENNAIQFENVWFMKWGAMTFGNAILYGAGTPPHEKDDKGVETCDHEKQHTYQYELLGPLYLPAYFGCGIETLFYKNKDFFGNGNRMENGPYCNPPRMWE